MASKEYKPIWSNDEQTLSNVLVKDKLETYNVVTEWYDGTPMDDSKIDSDLVYVKYDGKYLLRNFEYGQVLQKDTMDEMRNLSSYEILLLKLGVYKHVQLNGYYEKGDTPAPINYHLSDTVEEDDGGSVIEIIGGGTLLAELPDIVSDKYFGGKEGENHDSEESFNILKSLYKLNGKTVRHSKGAVYNLKDTVEIEGVNLKIQGNGSIIRQQDDSGMMERGRLSLLYVKGEYNVLEGMYVDGNIENNYVIREVGGEDVKIHFSANSLPNVGNLGINLIVIGASNTTIKDSRVENASWSNIDVRERSGGVISNVVIQNNIITQAPRDIVTFARVNDVTIRGNIIRSFLHHGIHSYINNKRVLIEDNQLYNDTENIFEWYSGIDKDEYSLSAIVIDHGLYANKTEETIVRNNRIIEDREGSIKSGIITQGFPKSVEIRGNRVVGGSSGIFLTRGNPIGETCVIKDNVILGVDTGIRIWTGNSGEGWQGGFTTPQETNIEVVNNMIESIYSPLRISGTPLTMDEWYSSYQLNFENNNIKGKPEYLVDNEINFTGNGGKHEVVFRNNYFEEDEGDVRNTFLPVNQNKGNALVYIDVAEPYHSNRYTSTIRNTKQEYYRILEFQPLGSRSLNGTIHITDIRRIYNIAQVDFNKNGNEPMFIGFRYLRRLDNPTHEAIRAGDFVAEEVVEGGVNKIILYFKPKNSLGDYRFDFSHMYFNNAILPYVKIPTIPESQPTIGENTVKVFGVNLNYNISKNVPLVIQPSVNPLDDITSSDLEGLVSDVNDVISEYNKNTSLVNELKAVVNNIITNMTESGNMRGQ